MSSLIGMATLPFAGGTEVANFFQIFWFNYPLLRSVTTDRQACTSALGGVTMANFNIAGLPLH
jgi:hypothetical protein